MSARDDARFPRSKRIRRRADFLRIQSKGTRVSTPHFLLLVSPRDDCEPARLGLVASRKIGNAVARNRAKRLVREVFRRHPEIFPAGVDVVVIVRSGAAELPLPDVESEIVGARGRLAAASSRRDRASGRQTAQGPRGSGPG